MKSDPQALKDALEVITETYTNFAAECIKAGACGIFFATTDWASRDMLNEEQWDEWGRPYDLRVLKAVQERAFQRAARLQEQQPALLPRRLPGARHQLGGRLARQPRPARGADQHEQDGNRRLHERDVARWHARHISMSEARAGPRADRRPPLDARPRLLYPCGLPGRKHPRRSRRSRPATDAIVVNRRKKEAEFSLSLFLLQNTLRLDPHRLPLYGRGLLDLEGDASEALALF